VGAIRFARWSVPGRLDSWRCVVSLGCAPGGQTDRAAESGARLRLLCEETGRTLEAKGFARQAAAIGGRAPGPARKAKAGTQRVMPMRQQQEVQEMLSPQPGRSMIAHRSGETRRPAGWARPGNDRAPAGQSGIKQRDASGQCPDRVCLGHERSDHGPEQASPC
jgi:hypothetical protein